MTKPTHHGRPAKPEIKAQDIQGAKFLKQITELLRPLHEHCPDPKRTLHYDEYCAWLLLYFFTPILTSLRGLKQASELEQIRQRLGLPRFSLGSFSEAGNVFDPELLVPIMEEIGQRLSDIEPDPRLLHLERRPIAVDGTLLTALAKMVWALWLDEEHRAAKLHLQLDLLKGIPEHPSLTHAQASESRQLQQNLQAGRLYVADRGYFDYELMAAILAAESSFVLRVHGNVSVAEVLRENPISAEAARAGVVSDQIVRVGCNKANQRKIDRPLRLVRIHVSETADSSRRPNRVDAKTKLYRSRSAEHEVVLLSDLLELDVSLLGLLFRYRWQIELFFRWFKKVLQAERLLSLSENGLTIVVYCALIASLLVVLWTGKKPTKRTYELLCFYFMGLVSDAELLAHLSRLKAADSKK